MYQLVLKIIKEDNFLSLAGNLILAILGFAGFALLARDLDTDSFAKWVLFLVSNVATVAYLCYASTTGELDAVMQPIQSFYESIGVK